MPKFHNDDMAAMGRCLKGNFNNTSDVIVDGYFDDPLISAELSGMIQEAEMMGYDLDDPEMLGAWLKNLVSKIKKKVKGKKMPKVSVDTGKGTAQIGPEGITWTDQQAAEAAEAAAVPATTTGGMQGLFKNPLVIAAAVGLPLLLLGMKKKGGRR